MECFVFTYSEINGFVSEHHFSRTAARNIIIINDFWMISEMIAIIFNVLSRAIVQLDIVFALDPLTVSVEIVTMLSSVRAYVAYMVTIFVLLW